jgi:hypothetical protein
VERHAELGRVDPGSYGAGRLAVLRAAAVLNRVPPSRKDSAPSEVAAEGVRCHGELLDPGRVLGYEDGFLPLFASE